MNPSRSISPTPAARSRARRFALQALYQMQLTDCSAAEVEAQFLQDYDMKRVDTDYLHELLAGVAKHRGGLIAAFSGRLDRSEKELDAVSRAALLIGSFEIIHRIDIPYRVAINEGVELAKQFGAADSFKFVNSVLDSLAIEYRAVERASGNR
ncbi:MAG: transcription antitermination factor NusB [Pseudomonadales bacterium]